MTTKPMLTIISRTLETMQVTILAEVELSFPSGRKQIRKMSFTRHLQNVGGYWMGYGLERNGHVMTRNGIAPDYPTVNYTDDVKRALIAARTTHTEGRGK